MLVGLQQSKLGVSDRDMKGGGRDLDFISYDKEIRFYFKYDGKILKSLIKGVI